MSRPLEILAVPACADNYIWIAHNRQHACIVDPGDATPVLAALHAHRLEPVAILLTHHHADHTGGVSALLQQHPLPVFGPHDTRMPEVDHPCTEGAQISLPELPPLYVLHIPGHTRTHLAFYCPEADALFCGDTLFSGGCGRLFEAPAETMWHSLQRLAALPPATRIYCAHEYTLANLRFAQMLEPDSIPLRTYAAHAHALRDSHLPTLPSTLAIEHDINPFLHPDRPAIRASLHTQGRLPAPADPLACFAALREWKNQFR